MKQLKGKDLYVLVRAALDPNKSEFDAIRAYESIPSYFKEQLDLAATTLQNQLQEQTND